MESPYLYAMSDDDLNTVLQIVESEKGVPRLNRVFDSPNHVLVEELGKMVWLWNYESLKNKKFIRKFFVENYVEICSLPPLTQEQAKELGESAQILSRVIEKINTWALPAIANSEHEMAEALLADLFIDAAGCRFGSFSNSIHQLRRISHIPIQGKHVSIHDIMRHPDYRGEMSKIVRVPFVAMDMKYMSVDNGLKRLELKATVENAIVQIVLRNDTEAMSELKSLLTGYSATCP